MSVKKKSRKINNLRYIMKRPLLKLGKIVTINLLLLILLFEAASLALYFHHTGRFFYTRDKEKRTLTLPSEGEVLNEAGPDTIKRTLHPYFGFVYDAHARNKLQFSNIEYAPNNFGLLSPYDYPYRRKSNNQFIIGIFGGSVAMYYGFYELENHVLVNTLKQLPYFQDKEIVVLPFASGSYKQPQQLIELNYFAALGQDLDLVINIDGFNETALAYLNNKAGYDASMPSVEMYRPLVQLANRGFSSNQLGLTLEILKLKADLRAADQDLNGCRLASCYGLTWIKVRYLLRQYQKQSEEFNRLTTDRAGDDSLVHVNRHAQPLDDAAVLEDMASVWAKSEVAMNQLLTARRIPYFQVIQPNQYYPTARKFSESEQKAQLNPSTSYSEGVIKGYPKLIAKIEDLKSAGVKVINAVTVFDETSEGVYVDSCCHYNRLGNDVFARFVAEQIAKSLDTGSAARETVVP